MKTKDAAAAFVSERADRCGVTAMSKALGVSRSAIYQWGEYVPKLRQYQIEIILKEQGKDAPKRGKAPLAHCGY